MKDELGRKQILRAMCSSIKNETIGLFIGSGFSRAIKKESDGKDLPDWKELLQQLCNRFKVPIEEAFANGVPYPEVASNIIHAIEKKRGDENGENAQLLVKNEIARMFNNTPKQGVVLKYKEYFNLLNPNWVATTNYDNYIEHIVGAKAYTIMPGECFYNAKGLLPIVHLHGSVRSPSKIVISTEDYTEVSLASNYMQKRLPVLMSESTVLMLGYSMRDINIRMAIKNYQAQFPIAKCSTSFNFIVHLLYKSEGEPLKCYIASDGIIYYEISDFHTFFEELKREWICYSQEQNEAKSKRDELCKEFEKDVTINKFIEDKSYRINMIKSVYASSPNENDIYNNFRTFLDMVFQIAYYNASGWGQFQEYAVILNIVLDLVTNARFEEMPIVFQEYLVQEFDNIAFYTGRNLGQSFAANDVFNFRKDEIPKEFKELLESKMPDKFREMFK